MSLLTQASLVLTPNAVKASKLYSIIPSNGNGDMTVVRATTATRVNSSGLIESVAANVPRLNYDGSCPSILVEPQRTNILLNSVWAGGGSTPTSWTFNANTAVSTPVTSIKNPNVTAYNFNGVSDRGFLSQITPFTINNTYAISIYVESVTITTTLASILVTANATGTTTYLKNNVTISSSSNIEAGNTYTLIFVATATTTVSLTRMGLGVSGVATGNFTLSMPQVEVGSASVAAYSTSYIPTVASTVTRNADVITRNNIYTNNLITSLGGTWFIELDNNIPYIRDNASATAIQTSSVSASNAFVIKTAGGGSNRCFIGKRVSNVESVLYITLTNTVKIAIDWNGTTADVFVNGVKVVTATSFPATIMEFFTADAIDVPKYIKSMMLFPRPLTDAECIALTTL